MESKLKRHFHIKHLEHIYLLISMGIIVVCSFLIGWWLFYPYKIMEVKSITLDKNVYQAGEHIPYTITYCKYTPKDGKVLRSLINGTITTFTPFTGNLPMGCRTMKNKDLKIPENADPDTYHLEATVIYEVNPIRNIYVYWRSENFIVR